MTSKIRFVTDSASDIPPELVEKWEIVVVPCFVNYGGESYADDGVELVRNQYYAQLADMDETPTTAAMPPAVAADHIRPLLDEADHIVILTVPAKLSAIYNSMRLAVEQLKIPEDRYTLIDSGSVSLGLAFQVLIGAEVAAETGDLQQTINAIEQARANIRVYATIGSIDFLRRSGRVGWATAGIAGLLNIKPVVEVVDGEVNAVARVRTFNRALDKMVELAREQGTLERLGLMHINNPEGMEYVKTQLADVIPPPSHIITGIIGPTVGTHIGVGSVGLVTVRQHGETI
jgi:DegV family protein with EDD domain